MTNASIREAEREEKALSDGQKAQIEYWRGNGMRVTVYSDTVYIGQQVEESHQANSIYQSDIEQFGTLEYINTGYNFFVKIKRHKKWHKCASCGDEELIEA